ncbi:MAG: adenosylhomocysteinase, partial [Candidatus Lokiarchaeota archaeon]|nr:adenosylhomocysteinase [Candidatus Lokiarchaeota archaeon]
KEIKPIRHNVEELIFPNGKKVYLLAKGRLANLVLSEGHPSEVMDMSFALQSLMSEYIVKNKDSLKSGMVDVPADIDDKVGILKLKSMGVEIDTLTEEQYNYIHGFLDGT